MARLPPGVPECGDGRALEDRQQEHPAREAHHDGGHGEEQRAETTRCRSGEDAVVEGQDAQLDGPRGEHEDDLEGPEQQLRLLHISLLLPGSAVSAVAEPVDVFPESRVLDRVDVEGGWGECDEEGHDDESVVPPVSGMRDGPG